MQRDQGRILLTTLALIVVLLVQGQSEYKKMSMNGKHRSWTLDFSDTEGELQISSVKKQELAPEPLMNSSQVKADLDRRRREEQRIAYKTGAYKTTVEEIAPDVTRAFNGKPLGSAGVPNDNTMAVSNDGIIISAINTTVTILDSEGNVLKFRTLSGIAAGQLGILDRYYDPKVLYDPTEDRFILVFLEGSESSDTRIIVGFTQTNDPTGLWNFYQLDGNPFGGDNWSDYPIIAHNGEDLYITVNSLKDNTSWQEGFLQSFIWQINKNDGYSGLELRQNLFYDIKYNNKSVWSICPVQPAVDFESTDMYFLSVRPDAASNDTVFLHYINEGSVSGNGEHSLRVLTSNIPYGVPPSGLQPRAGLLLQTNDTRVLSATLLDDEIHYTQSCIVQDPLSSGIYHAIISDLNGDEEKVEAHIISNDRLDYAYPSITYTGDPDNPERAMLITFSHVGLSDFPGTSMIFYNRLPEFDGIYSNVFMAKQGDSVIDVGFLADSIERWGDYTDIQRKYNETGVVWLCGSYGDENGLNNVWLAKINVNNELDPIEQILVFPNPAENMVNVVAPFSTDESVNLLLTDTRGVIVQRLDDQMVHSGVMEFVIETSGLQSGIYFLSIVSESGEVLHSQKIVVN